MPARHEPLSRAAIDRLAESMRGREGPDALLDRVCELIASHRGLVGATLTCFDAKGRIAAVGAHPAQLQDAVREQVERSDGPCVESHRRNAAVIVDDVAAARGRGWARWAAQVAALGATRAASEPVSTGGTVVATVGTLGDGDQPIGLVDDPPARSVVELAAMHAAVVLAHGDVAEVNAQLQEALTKRVRVEQAKGALAAHLRVSTDEAFEHLRRFARGRNRRIHDLADQILQRLTAGETVPDGLPAAAPTSTAEAPLRTTAGADGLRLEGAADVTALAQLEQALAGLWPGEAAVDLSAVEFIDARCVRALVRAAERLPEPTSLTVRPPSTRAANVLELLGVHDHPRIRVVTG